MMEDQINYIQDIYETNHFSNNIEELFVNIKTPSPGKRKPLVMANLNETYSCDVVKLINTPNTNLHKTETPEAPKKHTSVSSDIILGKGEPYKWIHFVLDEVLQEIFEYLTK